jgi:hypothetical protein
MDTLCDNFYDKEFYVADELPLRQQEYKLAFEMMRIDLCRNVGGSAEDMVEFIKRVEEEIDATGKKLKELKQGNIKCDDCSVGCNAKVANCKNFVEKKED